MTRGCDGRRTARCPASQETQLSMLSGGSDSDRTGGRSAGRRRPHPGSLAHGGPSRTRSSASGTAQELTSLREIVERAACGRFELFLRAQFMCSTHGPLPEIHAACTDVENAHPRPFVFFGPAAGVACTATRLGGEASTQTRNLTCPATMFRERSGVPWHCLR